MNSEQQQQRIMGYFIEEAREHLQTIEQGVLNLQEILDDSESINELFRAAHSIKGGAAMLGVGSIQHVAHRLEDFFKILKENSQINVDERLKSLLLAGFDPLSELLEELQGGYKISDELTAETNNRVKPVFAELEAYLNQLVTEVDGEVSTQTPAQAPTQTSSQKVPEKAVAPIEQPDIVSQRSIFQKEVTTKMRDMLQLFRSADTPESRSQLQTVCNYFQEVGNNFDLRNWTNLVIQIKNAIAQPNNSYRTLAPILIRELKEAQDLVLDNREAEIAVSSQIQSLLPYRFSEPEDDEVSTIFTTASGDIDFDDEPIAEDRSIADHDNIARDLNPIDIDLFADDTSEVNEEIFDLSEVNESQIDQIDWMDGEYEVAENQHIDGPKVGASELKSLAILFENDDIDFDAAWEDIESNETNMSNQGVTSSSDNRDDFADLLGNASSNDDETIPNLNNKESSIDQLFGDFSTEDSTAEIRAEESEDSLFPSEDSLFPDDLDGALNQVTDNFSEFETDAEDARTSQASIEELFSNDFGKATDQDEQFDRDLGLDLLEQNDNPQIENNLPTSDRLDQIDQIDLFDDINISEINTDDIDFYDLSESSAEQLDDLSDSYLSDHNLMIDAQDESDSLSSEEYFAEIARQENALANGNDDDGSIEPFALTFSEEGMTLLEDPFAIDENLDGVLLGDSTSEPPQEAKLQSNDTDPLDTTGLKIFDELGFDSDELDESVTFKEDVRSHDSSTSMDEETNEDLGGFFAGISDLDDTNQAITNLSETVNANNIDATSNDDISSEEGLENFFDGISTDSADAIDTDITDDISSEEGLENFFDAINTDSADAIDTDVTDDISSEEGLEDFFMESANNADHNEISNLSDAIDEFSQLDSDDNLDDFFAANNSFDSSLAADPLVDDIPTDEPAQDLGDRTEDNFSQLDQSEQLDDDFFVNSELSSESISSESIGDLGDITVDRAEQEFSINGDPDEFLDRSEQLEDITFTSKELSYEDDVAEEISDSESLADFFAESESPAIASSHNINDEINGEFNDEINDELDDRHLASYAESITSTDDLGDFFDVAEEPQDLNQQEFVDFGESEDVNLDFLDMVTNEDVPVESPVDLAIAPFSEELIAEELIAEELIAEESLTDSSDLADLFVNAREEDLTVLESDFDFDDNRELTQSDEFADLTNALDGALDSALDKEFQDFELESIEANLTTQEDIDLEVDSPSTATTTIDNLVDFFQGNDEIEDNSLSIEEIVSSDLAIDESIVFDESDPLSDLNQDDLGLDYPLTQDSQAKPILEPENQLPPEELNGIDDNFDFDDLEAMIGSSINIADEGLNSEQPDQFSSSINSINSNGASQVTPSINVPRSHQNVVSPDSPDNDDMDFDALEALLSDADTIDAETNGANNFTSIPPVPSKPADDFDELENMLQSAFAKDVGPIKTKAPVRPPTTTRKQRLTDTTMRVDVKYLDSLNNLVGELVVNRNLLEQDQERLQQFITNLLHQVQLLSDVSQRMRDQYDRSLLEASLTAGRGRSYSSFETSYANDGANSNSSVSNDFEGIEFDRYNTFHVLSQEIIELIVRVRESASDIEFVVGETDQVTRQLGTITTQVQDDLKQSRMVPFAQIADRLPRGIRDRALKTGKQAELEIFGRETLIDKAILESLTDPLTHLVNNAIDHGLEDPATRQAAGKSATGRLTVRAYHQGNQTVISISDDGAGISPDRVKKSAVSKGVRSQAEVDRLNDTEVYALLFEAGFSTAAQADEFKGRGVGLDVVKTCLDDIRGVIIVESVIGKGTTFTIRLPLTLSISKAMFCISDRARIAFPVDGFEDMVEVPQSQIVLNEKGQPCLPWRDTVLPFQHLSNLLSYSRHLSRSSIYGKQENDELCIIILRNDTSYLALQVDQFLGEYEIVIKQLEGPIPQPAGIAGATVLGDGRVMAIANVLELFDIASGRLRPSTSGATIQPTVEEDVAVDPTVLIVDDSITVRELLSLTFAKVGYRVEQAKDGQDAWEKLRAGLPCDMIFCDIEMPRMDGLDLLSRLQKDSRLKEIPVAMLTSRGADRHRQSAIQLGAKGYFTKPYLEEELLSASKRLLNGETLPI
ncbi:response regulator [Pseudanabaena sp. UWO310]|uniref:hybrid sensor histidine kinase/response regulator n=1 Tax=Pseudanabaena sp. UWO310 TaxID=2480795 RepID=UPI00115C1EF7|nr:response regulator [Pseudanabaena sp. UWO310]TYQ31827.1 response regulator [Pseudanabaena sp. UWO310]